MKKSLITLAASIFIISSLPLLAYDGLLEKMYKGGNYRAGYSTGIDKQITLKGAKSAFIESNKTNLSTKKFGTLMNTADVYKYRGKRIQLTVYIKTQDVTGRAGAWFRIDGRKSDKRVSGKGKTLAFDNMRSRPIKGTTEWAGYSVVLDVPSRAREMAFGVLLVGSGKVWFNELNFHIVSQDTPVTDIFKKSDETDS